jgi:hypothetical protein
MTLPNRMSVDVLAFQRDMTSIVLPEFRTRVKAESLYFCGRNAIIATGLTALPLRMPTHYIDGSSGTRSTRKNSSFFLDRKISVASKDIWFRHSPP